MGDLIAKAEQSAQAKPATAPTSSNYTELYGPVEVEGGHGDAYLVESPSQVTYVEFRPRNGGRVKRSQVIASAAIFRAQGWLSPEDIKEREKKSRARSSRSKAKS